MNNYQSRNQFQPPFRTGSLQEEERDAHLESLLEKKSNTRTNFNYPRRTMQSLPGLQPGQGQSLVPWQPHGRSLTIVQSEPHKELFMPPPGPISQFVPITSQRSKPKKGTIIMMSIAILFIIVGGFTWINTKIAPSDVTLYQVSEQNVTQYSGGGGIIFPLQQFALSYPTSEYAVDVLVKAGDHVSLNQSLLRLDPTQLNAEIKQSSDNVAATQAYLSSVSVSGNATSIAQAQQQYTLAQSKYNALVAESSSRLLHNGDLISPMNGVITAVNVNAGEIFAADTPLLVIMDEATVIVHVKVPLANLSQVHTGQQATVTPSALPNQDFQGSVSSIVPQADPQTDTFEVWVSVPNPRKILLPGMSAFVRIQTPQRALVVPRLAILNPTHGAATFVVRDQYAYLQPVHVSMLVGDRFLVQKGLRVGDKIVLVGQDTLRDGQGIHVRSIEQ